MKTINIIITTVLLLGSLALSAQVAINTDGSAADASAMLDIKSTDKGVLVPRMTKTQRDAITSPETGLLIYQSDNTPGFYFYNGSAWVVVGSEATDINSLTDGKTGGSSVFLGSSAGNVDDGIDNYNVGIGDFVLSNNTTGSANTSVGTWSLAANTEGINNTAFGFGALSSNISGNYNSAFGLQCLAFNTTDSANTAFGYQAGFNVTGGGNVFIGYQAGLNETGSNKLYISNSDTVNPLIYGDFDANKVVLNGNVGIGTTSPSQKLSISGGSLLVDAFSTQETGIFFRNGFTDNYNMGILSYDHSDGGASPDGLTIAAWDGVSISTGSNSRNIRMIVTQAGHVGIGTTSPDASASLDVSSTTNGFLPPRMTTTQRNTISSPATGLMVYNITTKRLNFYNGSEWITSDGTWANCGNPIIYAGQSYNTVQIGTQCWMAENLNVGVMIVHPTNPTNNGTIEKFCSDNNTVYCDTYGGLYQWDEMMQYVTTEGSGGICPTGWHLPTSAEWTTLSDYLGGVGVAGGKLKEAGLTHWLSPNTGATNESGFTGRPGGLHNGVGAFFNRTAYGSWYSSTEAGVSAMSPGLAFNNSQFNLGSSHKSFGRSVRCIKN